MPDVVLVCMPFGPVFSPSLGLSLLKAGLARHGIASRVRYFSIDFAERVGQDFYCGVASEDRPPNRDLAGEWIFSRALFGPEHGSEAYLEEVLLRPPGFRRGSSDRRVTPALVRRIRAARDLAEEFLEWCRDALLAERPKLVGFTSVFQQHVASLALARLVKRAASETVVVLGGANCEGPMGAETVRRFPWLDGAVSGEGDLVFPEIARRALAGRSLEGLAGVRTPGGVEAESRAGRFPGAPAVADLDALPEPDYADYFEAFEASRYHREWQPSLFFETSRGCWWGERVHCTFCGLNGASMIYRSKSPGRAVDELVRLTGAHPGCDVQVVDNILDLRYFETVLPELAARRLGVDLFYETKSNLRKEQVRSLKRAGIRRIQAGIESLGDETLTLMGKGVTALQNLQLLKWCKQAGVEPHWNLIWGFPGEPPGEYARVAGLVPRLTHLPPPGGWGPIRLDRFSPNFSEAEARGFTDVRPLPAYRHIYPFEPEALANLAYYFSFGYREPRDVEAYVRPLVRELEAWKAERSLSDLFSADVGGALLIWDLRRSASQPLHVLRGLDRLVYEACDAIGTPERLARRIASRREEPVSPELVVRRLEPLVALGLVVRDRARYLALSVSLGEYEPGPAALGRFREVLANLGRPTRAGVRVALPAFGDGGSRGPARRRPNSGRRGRGRRRGRLDPACFELDAEGSLLVRADPT